MYVLIYFYFKEKKLSIAKACEDELIEKRSQKHKKLKVGVVSMPHCSSRL
jgi:hypothetical protein